jgi:hypothetical protein
MRSRCAPPCADWAAKGRRAGGSQLGPSASQEPPARRDTSWLVTPSTLSLLLGAQGHTSARPEAQLALSSLVLQPAPIFGARFFEHPGSVFLEG